MIKRFHHNKGVITCYNGGLKKIGEHKVDRHDICQMDATDLEAFANGDLSEKILVNKQ